MANNNSSSKNPFIIALVLIAVLIIAWHLLLPLLGVSLAITGGIFSALIVTIILMCVGIGLFFLLTGLGVVIVSILAVVVAIVAIILFPVLFPIVVPLLIILLLVGYYRRKNEQK